MATDRVRIGIIGVGQHRDAERAGLSRARAVRRRRAVRPAARRARAADARSGASSAATPTSTQLLADADIDAVEILSPTPLHAEHTIAALRRRQARVVPEADREQRRRRAPDGRRRRREPTGCFRVTENCCHYPPLRKARDLIRVGRDRHADGRAHQDGRRPHRVASSRPTSIPPATRGASTPRVRAATSSTTSCTSTRWRSGSSTSDITQCAGDRAAGAAVLRGADRRALRVRTRRPARHDGGVVRARHVHPQRLLRRRRVLRDPGHPRLHLGHAAVRQPARRPARRSCSTKKTAARPSFAELDASYDGSFRRSAAAFVDGLLAGEAPDLDPADGDRGAAAVLRGLPGVERAAAGRPRRRSTAGSAPTAGRPPRRRCAPTSRSCSGGKPHARAPRAGHPSRHARRIPTSTRRDTPGSRLLFALVANAAFLAVEVVGGFAFGSLALLADAVHMITDVVALAMAYARAADRAAARRPNGTRSASAAPRCSSPQANGAAAARRRGRRSSSKRSAGFGTRTTIDARGRHRRSASLGLVVNVGERGRRCRARARQPQHPRRVLAPRSPTRSVRSR